MRDGDDINGCVGDGAGIGMEQEMLCGFGDGDGNTKLRNCYYRAPSHS